MSARRVDLVYFGGCARVGEARQLLAAAYGTAGLPAWWTEWDVRNPITPPEFRRLPSPSILIDGKEIDGGATPAGAMACRLGGFPTVESLAARLRAPAA